MVFKVGDSVKWQHESDGLMAEKFGVIVFDCRTLPINESPTKVAARLFEGHRAMFDEKSWFGTRFLVEVKDGSTEDVTPKLYKPKHSLLVIDEQQEQQQ